MTPRSARGAGFAAAATLLASFAPVQTPIGGNLTGTLPAGVYHATRRNCSASRPASRPDLPAGEPLARQLHAPAPHADPAVNGPCGRRRAAMRRAG